MHLFVPCKHSGCIVSYHPRPPKGGYLFQTRLRGSLKERGPYLGGWGLFDLAKMVLSVLHKLEGKVDKPKFKNKIQTSNT